MPLLMPEHLQSPSISSLFLNRAVPAVYRFVTAANLLDSSNSGIRFGDQVNAHDLAWPGHVAYRLPVGI